MSYAFEDAIPKDVCVAYPVCTTLKVSADVEGRCGMSSISPLEREVVASDIFSFSALILT